MIDEMKSCIAFKRLIELLDDNLVDFNPDTHEPIFKYVKLGVVTSSSISELF